MIDIEHKKEVVILALDIIGRCMDDIDKIINTVVGTVLPESVRKVKLREANSIVKDAAPCFKKINEFMPDVSSQELEARYAAVQKDWNERLRMLANLR